MSEVGADAALVRELRARIEGKFAEATLELLPFPHLIIGDFFAPEVYERILSTNPFRGDPGREWMSAATSKRLKTTTPYETRKQIDVDTIDDPLWASISSCFLDDHWFEGVVAAKFPEFFLLRFGELAGTPELFDRCTRDLFVQRHDVGYSIGPHTDLPTRIFTCIFSFADREGLDEYGTVLMRPDDPLTRCWGNDHHDFEGFQVAKVAPYVPNGFLLFFKTRQSFHAVRLIDDAAGDRYGMQFQLHEPGGGVFHDLSEPHLLDTRLEKRPPFPVSWAQSALRPIKRRATIGRRGDT